MGARVLTRAHHIEASDGRGSDLNSFFVADMASLMRLVDSQLRRKEGLGLRSVVAVLAIWVEVDRDADCAPAMLVGTVVFELTAERVVWIGIHAVDSMIDFDGLGNKEDDKDESARETPEVGMVSQT